MTLGEKMRCLRVRAKKSLKEQSQSIRVSINSLYRWEHDLVTPRKQMLIKIAESFDVSTDWLLSDSTVPSLINETEQKLLGLYRTLPSQVRYKVLGYVERVCVEERTVDYINKM